MSEKKLKLKEIPPSYEYNEERFELIEGIRYDMQAAPAIRHQQLVTYFLKNLEDTCAPDGLILTSPIDVKFNDDNECQPDLIYIANDNLHIVTEKKVIGAPDLIIEILSPSTSNNDKIHKKAVYERFGVKEYWIVDPTHLYVDQFILTDQKYILAQTYGNKDSIRSDLLTCINVDLESIFSRLLVFDRSED
ncbi:Uma2 family endonuclease [Bacillus sp. FJAT-50079]|uniref:Uma2 family endonuclease n=1 Tax=Bacillus sp. FJAT-50079 TaxID=2833577 RepID=UPI001BCA47F2|nr:Uma2 family endonuclease [Bacillus sp. FJAT-50079]MBS4209477.1 Uma2 family endonuclease [Bacillus sp. FJAT-50079]